MDFKYNVFAVFVFVSFIIVAHILAIDSYDWCEHTISELAAQNYKDRLVMKSGFILFGGILFLGVLRKLLNKQSDFIAELSIVFYALAVFVSGLYSTKPFIRGLHYSESEALVHSIAATVAGTSFCMALLIFSIKDNKRRFVHALFFVFATICSALFMISEQNLGLIQKIMYLGSFIWLVLFYNTNSKQRVLIFILLCG
nr:DUF998 domain-containing protein [Allomuricauda sp.]